MSNIKSEVHFYRTIAININKKVGGQGGYCKFFSHLEAEAKSKDVFAIQMELVNKEMNALFDLIKTREGKTEKEVLYLNMEARSKLSWILTEIEKMRSLIRKDKNENMKEIQTQMINRIFEKSKRFETLIEESQDLKTLLQYANNNNTYTKTMPLLNKEPTHPNQYFKKENKYGPPKEIELEAQERWKRDDERNEKKLDELGDLTILWKNRVIEIGKTIDVCDEKIDGLTNDVDKVNDKLLRSNKQLKNIINKYSKPHKFCIDLILVLLLIGMLVAIIQMAKK